MWLVAVLLSALLAAGSVSAEGGGRVCPNEADQAELWAKLLAAGDDAPQSLKDHTAEVQPKELIQISDNVWMAFGYGLSNSVLIRGTDGLIVVDTLDSFTPAQEVLAQFQDVARGDDGSILPVTGIIYTHSHPDHISGGPVFAGAADPALGLQVWAHKNLVEEFWSGWQYSRPQLFARGLRQIGSLLPLTTSINAGLGLTYFTGQGSGLLLTPPTHLLEEDEMDITISGVQMKLMYIPGETRDQVGIYLQDQKIFVCADDYYHTFPNLYAIRGTKPRPVSQWMESVDLMLSLDIDTLLPMHTRPVIGAEDIRQRLQDYRDAIQFTNDQTLRVMNQGYSPDEVVRRVHLPASLAQKEYLVEHYGTFEWSVKTVFESQLGWFSGLPEELYPPTQGETGCRTLELLGEGVQDGKMGQCNRFQDNRDRGRCVALDNVKELIAADTSDADLRWALVLVSHVVNCDTDAHLKGDADAAGHLKVAKKVRADVMMLLANLQSTPNGRNYLLTYALEETCLGPTKGINPYANDGATMLLLPIDRLLLKMAVMLRAEDLEGQEYTVVVAQAASGGVWSLALRNSVLRVVPGEESAWDLKITLADTDAEQAFRSTLGRTMSVPDFAQALGENLEEPGLDAEEFFSWFDDPSESPIKPYVI
jgi:alkyl sulfatase BDS1-like metallo-beta-lactamase superfamily hydrolase